MTEKSTIEIIIEDNKVAVNSDLPMAELNLWLDHIKYLIVSGQIEQPAAE